MASGYKQYEVILEGDSLIMHNGRTSNPLDPFAKAMKEVSIKHIRPQNAVLLRQNRTGGRTRKHSRLI